MGAINGILMGVYAVVLNNKIMYRVYVICVNLDWNA